MVEACGAWMFIQVCFLAFRFVSDVYMLMFV